MMAYACIVYSMFCTLLVFRVFILRCFFQLYDHCPNGITFRSGSAESDSQWAQPGLPDGGDFQKRQRQFREGYIYGDITQNGSNSFNSAVTKT